MAEAKQTKKPNSDLTETLERFQLLKDLSLADALVLAQSEMINPKKSGTANIPTKSGKTFSYSFAVLDEIVDIIRPACNKYGVLFSQPVVSVRLESGGCVEKVQTVVEKGTERSLMGEMELKAYIDEKARGAQITYFRRQLALAAFGLAGEDDTSEAVGNREPTPPIPRGADSYDKDADDKRRAKENELADKHEVMKDKIDAARATGISDESIGKWVKENIGKPQTELTVEDMDKVIEYLSERIKEYKENVPF